MKKPELDTSLIEEKTVVVVRRLWHRPEIHAFISSEEIGAKMDLNDFIQALVEEIFDKKKRLWLLDRNEALGKAVRGATAIIDEMKNATGNVV